MPEVGHEGNGGESRRRRSTDRQPVPERLGSGVDWSGLIQTVTQIGTLIASFSILISVIWWASKIDTKQGIATAERAALTVEVEEGVEDRRAMAEQLVRISEVVAKATATLDLTVTRLNDTRDIALGREGTEPVEP